MKLGLQAYLALSVTKIASIFGPCYKNYFNHMWSSYTCFPISRDRRLSWPSIFIQDCPLSSFNTASLDLIPLQKYLSLKSDFNCNFQERAEKVIAGRIWVFWCFWVFLDISRPFPDIFKYLTDLGVFKSFKFFDRIKSNEISLNQLRKSKWIIPLIEQWFTAVNRGYVRNTFDVWTP